MSDGRGCLQWGYPACAVYVRLTPTARGSVRKLTSADPTLHAQLHRATVFPARNGPSRPHTLVCLGCVLPKTILYLKTEKVGNSVQVGMKETSKETSSVRAPVYLDFTTRTVCLGGCGAQRGGLRGAACAGRGRTSCAGGRRSREPCATTLAVARKSCASRAASTPACDAFGGHGKKARRRASSQGVARGSKRQRSM